MKSFSRLVPRAKEKRHVAPPYLICRSWPPWIRTRALSASIHAFAPDSFLIEGDRRAGPFYPSFHARSRLPSRLVPAAERSALPGANKIKRRQSRVTLSTNPEQRPLPLSPGTTVQFAAAWLSPDPFTCGECDQLGSECTKRLRSFTLHVL
jgi:hypothetical protein